MSSKLAMLETLERGGLMVHPNVSSASEKNSPVDSPRVAEFFAGIGLVRKAVEQEGFTVVFANDIDPSKASLYAANFDDSEFVLGDVRTVKGHEVPDIELATASFPCTDLSLAGNRVGLSGDQSGMFWEFARVLEEMGERKPPVVLLENVVGFASSHNGEDMAAAIARLNALGYRCDLFVLDASFFVPQSRQRLFIVATALPVTFSNDWTESSLRPAWLWSFIQSRPELAIHTKPLPLPNPNLGTLADVVERVHHADKRWWDESRLKKFMDSLSSIQATRMKALQDSSRLSWATAYRRTRNRQPVWEVRADAISGCLRTGSGGSSKQAIVEAGRGKVRIRWMTAREYARLQGAPDFNFGDMRESAAIYGFGDAVCVPVVAWIARMYLLPALMAFGRCSRKAQ